MLSTGLRDASSTVEEEGEDEDAAFIPRSGIHDRSVGFTSQKEFAGTKMKIVKVETPPSHGVRRHCHDSVRSIKTSPAAYEKYIF